jgi:hypothetical protein
MVVNDCDGAKNDRLGQFTQLAVAEATDSPTDFEQACDCCLASANARCVHWIMRTANGSGGS